MALDEFEENEIPCSLTALSAQMSRCKRMIIRKPRRYRIATFGLTAEVQGRVRRY